MPEVERFGDALTLVVWPHLFGCVWTGLVEVDALKHLGERQRTIPGPMGVISYVRKIASLRVPRGVRAEASRIHNENKDRVVASATIIESTGFAASVARSITTGVMSVQSTPHPQEVFKELRVGVGFVLEHLDRPDMELDAVCKALDV